MAVDCTQWLHQLLGNCMWCWSVQSVKATSLGHLGTSDLKTSLLWYKSLHILILNLPSEYQIEISWANKRDPLIWPFQIDDYFLYTQLVNIRTKVDYDKNGCWWNVHHLSKNALVWPYNFAPTPHLPQKNVDIRAPHYCNDMRCKYYQFRNHLNEIHIDLL